MVISGSDCDDLDPNLGGTDLDGDGIRSVMATAMTSRRHLALLTLMGMVSTARETVMIWITRHDRS